MARSRNGEDERVDRECREPTAQTRRARAAFPESEDAKGNIDDQQQNFHGQPRVHEWVLLRDGHQHQRCGEQNRIDGVAEIA